MHSINFYVWEFLVARAFKKIWSYCPNIDEMRRAANENSKLFVSLDPRAQARPLEKAPFKGEWIKLVSDRPEIIILYLHGGAYILGQPESFRSFLTYLAARARADILSLDYPLAPEHPFPEALEYSYKAYRWLLDSGVDSKQIVIVGDSAAGGLALSVIQWIRMKGDPMPASVVSLCPWLSLDADRTYIYESLKKDRFLSPPVAELAIKCYADGMNKQNPLISPLFADLTGFPPIFIQTGTADSICEQSLEFERRAKLQNVTVTLDVWEGMPHDWQVIMASNVKESREAIDNICTFINSTTAHSRIMNKLHVAF